VIVESKINKKITIQIFYLDIKKGGIVFIWMDFFSNIKIVLLHIIYIERVPIYEHGQNKRACEKRHPYLRPSEIGVV